HSPSPAPHPPPAPALCVAPPGPHRALPSFPTRRSSDLGEEPTTAEPIVEQPVCTRSIPATSTPVRLSLRIAAGASTMPEPSSGRDRKSTRLNSSHVKISYAVFCLKKKNIRHQHPRPRGL